MGETTTARRTLVVILSDDHCHTVTYRGTSALRCRLCGAILAAVTAHFEACHPDQLADARKATRR